LFNAWTRTKITGQATWKQGRKARPNETARYDGKPFPVVVTVSLPCFTPFAAISSSAICLINGTGQPEVGYQLNKHWSLSLQAFNLLDRKDSDIDYYYTSRLPGEPAGGADDIHLHPAEPFALRGVLTCRF
jgi:hypothetical protein